MTTTSSGCCRRYAARHSWRSCECPTASVTAATLCGSSDGYRTGGAGLQTRLGLLDGGWRRRTLDSDEVGDVVTHVALQGLLTAVEALRRWGGQHPQVGQPQGPLRPGGGGAG